MKQRSFLLVLLGSFGVAGLLFYTGLLGDFSQANPAPTVVPPSKVEKQPDARDGASLGRPSMARAEIEALLARGTPEDLVMARAIEAGLTDFSLVENILSEIYSGAELEHQKDAVLMVLISDELSKPEGGLALITDQALRDEVIRGAISLCIAGDPKLLVTTIQNQLTDYSRTKALHALASALCQRGDVINASGIVEKMPKGELRLNALRTVVGARAKHDAPGAMEWIKSFDPDEQRTAESEIAQAISQALAEKAYCRDRSGQGQLTP
jgi:hypothetical protein